MRIACVETALYFIDIDMHYACICVFKHVFGIVSVFRCVTIVCRYESTSKLLFGVEVIALSVFVDIYSFLGERMYVFGVESNIQKVSRVVYLTCS